MKKNMLCIWLFILLVILVQVFTLIPLIGHLSSNINQKHNEISSPLLDSIRINAQGANHESYAGVATEGGYLYIAGEYYNYDTRNWDGILAKFNSSGTLIWNRPLSGADLEYFSAIAVAGDNLYLAGTKTSSGAIYSDGLLMKYSTNGSLIWERTWGGNDTDYFTGIAVEGDFVYLSGSSHDEITGHGEALLVKYNSSGHLLWNQTWCGVYWDIFTNVVSNGTSLYLVGSTAYNGANLNVLLAKYDSSTGQQIWNRTWGDLYEHHGFCVAVDGEFVFVGGNTYKNTIDGGDGVLLKYDNNGNLISNKTWGGAENDGFSAMKIAGGNVYLAGNTDWMGEHFKDALLVKYNTSGEQEWNCTWGGENEEKFNGIALDGENIYLVGYARPTGLLVILNYNINGSLIWIQSFGGKGDLGYWDFILTIIVITITISIISAPLITIALKTRLVIPKDDSLGSKKRITDMLEKRDQKSFSNGDQTQNLHMKMTVLLQNSVSIDSISTLGDRELDRLLNEPLQYSSMKEFNILQSEEFSELSGDDIIEILRDLALLSNEGLDDVITIYREPTEESYKN